MFLLDSDSCVRLLSGRGEALARHLRSVPPAEVAVCSVVRAELQQAARRSARVEENLDLLARFFAPLASLPFDDRCAEEYGMLRAQGETALRALDLMTAATARAHDATLVTPNPSAFRQLTGLRLADWTVETA
ncbi:MAG: type II toxin-antitoxin system VapC family toxin [Xanthomonadales bacterium]